MRSRACRIAGEISQGDAASRRVRTVAHACCEGCSCPCHRALVPMEAMPGDPVPLLIMEAPEALPVAHFAEAVAQAIRDGERATTASYSYMGPAT